MDHNSRGDSLQKCKRNGLKILKITTTQELQTKTFYQHKPVHIN